MRIKYRTYDVRNPSVIMITEVRFMPENAGSREFTGAAMFVPVNDDGRIVIIDHISEAVYDRITDTLLRSGYTDLTRFADNTYYKNEEEIS